MLYINYLFSSSTPNKSSERKSSTKSSKESLESNNPTTDVEKISNLSNSNDIHISELMTPTSFEVRIDNKEFDKLVDKQTCNEVACDIITDVEIKNVNIDLNLQTSVKEADAAVNEEVCVELASVSPVKTKADINTDLNQEVHEELASISPVKAVVTVDSTEAAVKNIDSADKMCLFSAKQSFDDSDITENRKRNTIEKSKSEKHPNQSIENGTRERTDDSILLFHDDESLLDSIDLSKIMIKSDDEDSDKGKFNFCSSLSKYL